MEIVPAILATTPEQFTEMIKKVEPFTERVHIDVVDGAFALGKSIMGYEEVQALESNLKFDAHLMVVHPSEYLPQWFKTKADRIFIQAESEGDIKELLLEIKGQGRKAGLVLNPETVVDTVLECLPMLDYIQFMTVHPGSYGRPFLTEVLDKIVNFHDAHPEIPIVVDGGINPQTIQLARGVGVQVVISGSYIMNSPDIGKAISELKGETNKQAPNTK